MFKNYICIILSFLLINCQFIKNKYKEHKGFIYGTYFKIKYLDNKNYISNIYNIFKNIEKSLSIYSKNSDLYKINNGNYHIHIDKNLKYIFLKSKEIFKITNGAFDPTLNNYNNISKYILNNNILIKNIGFDKINLKENRIFKPKEFFLDFNGITKGYVVDLISEFFNSKNIYNYIIEIGGEIRARGKNKNKKYWNIGIETPIQNQKLGENIIKSFRLNNEAIATSGCYRNFIKYPNSQKKYSHIINYKTGLPIPIDNKLLSVSVISKNCITADAYATAFMVLGIKNSKKIINNNKKIKLHALFIYKYKNIYKYIFI